MVTLRNFKTLIFSGFWGSVGLLPGHKCSMPFGRGFLGMVIVRSNSTERTRTGEQLPLRRRCFVRASAPRPPSVKRILTHRALRDIYMPRGKNWLPTVSRQFLTQLLGDLKITSTSTERQERSQNLAPVLVIISGSSLVFSRKIITSTGFYRCCAPDASAPVVLKNQSPNYPRPNCLLKRLPNCLSHTRERTFFPVSKLPPR